MTTDSPIKITEWRTLDQQEISDRVDSILRSWEGTPFVELTRIKGMGVDCFQLCAAFLDEVTGRPLGSTVLPRLSESIARNRPDIAREAILALRRAHPADSIDDGSIETGDIIVLRSTLATDGPLYEGHAMIAASENGHLYHAVRPAVNRSSYGGREVVKVYRPRRKDLWTR